MTWGNTVLLKARLLSAGSAPRHDPHAHKCAGRLARRTAGFPNLQVRAYGRFLVCEPIQKPDGGPCHCPARYPGCSDPARGAMSTPAEPSRTSTWTSTPRSRYGKRLWRFPTRIRHRPRAGTTGICWPRTCWVCDGRLAAVLDFGGLAVGDPTVGLVVACEVLEASSREVFRRAVEVDEESWLRGRACSR